MAWVTLGVAAAALFLRGWTVMTPEHVAYIEAGGSVDNVPSPWPWVGAALIAGGASAVVRWRGRRARAA